MHNTFAFRFTIMAIVALVLGGGTCNPDAYSIYVLNNYGSVRGQMIDIDDDSFAVLDKPEEGRMLVAHASKFYPMDRWRQVAATYLERTGRSCELAQSSVISPRQIEVYYACG